MKRVLAVMLIVAGCGGSRPKKESPIVNEGSDVPETCCCKSFPLSSDDGKAVYAMTPRIECSTRQGECVSDVQCQKTPPQ